MSPDEEYLVLERLLPKPIVSVTTIFTFWLAISFRRQTDELLKTWNLVETRCKVKNHIFDTPFSFLFSTSYLLFPSHLTLSITYITRLLNTIDVDILRQTKRTTRLIYNLYH